MRWGEEAGSSGQLQTSTCELVTLGSLTVSGDPGNTVKGIQGGVSCPKTMIWSSSDDLCVRSTYFSPLMLKRACGDWLRYRCPHCRCLKWFLLLAFHHQKFFCRRCNRKINLLGSSYRKFILDGRWKRKATLRLFGVWALKMWSICPLLREGITSVTQERWIVGENSSENNDKHFWK